MKIEEKRIIALLILLLGLSMLAAGIITGQVDYLLEFMRKIFEPSRAGLP